MREEKQGNEEFSGFITGQSHRLEASGGKASSNLALMAGRPAGNSTVLHLKGPLQLRSSGRQ